MIASEVLLDAVAAGVAVVAGEGRTVTDANRTFRAWFPGAEPGVPLAALVPDLDGEAVAFEASARRGRRPLALAGTIAPLDDGRAVVTVQDVSREREMAAMLESYAQMSERHTRALETEKARVDRLLLNLMPRAVYDEFKTFGTVTPQLYDPVSVLMLDFVGFTSMSVAADPAETVSELNDVFTAFDRIGEQFGCERIKTIGDAYLAVAGLPHANPDHVRAVAKAAVRFVRYLERRNASHKHQWRCRIGLASGPAVGSIVGIQKYVYDVFGPAVNLAARIQALAGPMEIRAHGDMAAELAEEGGVRDAAVVEIRGFGAQRVVTLEPELALAGVGK